MSRLRWTGVTLLAFAAGAFLCGHLVFGRYRWTYVDEKIAAGASGSAAHDFTVQLDGPVEIGVAFDRTSSSEGVIEAIRDQMDGTPIDLSWAILEDGQPAFRGESAKTYRSTWGGADSVGIVFGVFEASARRQYRVEHRTNKSFLELADSRPRLRLAADTSRRPFHSRFHAGSMLGGVGLFCTVVGGTVMGVGLLLTIRGRFVTTAA